MRSAFLKNGLCIFAFCLTTKVVEIFIFLIILLSHICRAT